MSKAWKDITTDHKTGHTVAKDYFKAWAFFAGLFYLLVLVPAVFLLTPKNLLLPLEPGMALVTLAFGLQGLKMADTYLNRKTADENNNPLQKKGTEEAPATTEIPLTNPPAGQEQL